jgi:hypothetical protein
MAIICRKYGLLFIMTPRTACTAIGELLCKHYGGEFLPPQDILNGNGGIAVQKKHSTLAELIRNDILTPEEADSLLKVAAVRNPFDTLVSLYFKQRYKYQPLLADRRAGVPAHRCGRGRVVEAFVGSVRVQDRDRRVREGGRGGECEEEDGNAGAS